MKTSIIHMCRINGGRLLALAGLTLLAPMLPGAPRAMAQDDYWHQRVSLFDKLPVTTDDIVFLGNSITDGGEFQELFGMENVLNRGIRSDRISGVMKRLEQVTSGKPKMIFLLIGINDVADPHNTAQSIADKYAELIKAIRTQSPQTQLYVQSIMPINNDFRRYKSLIGRESLIPDINERLKMIAGVNGAIFIDLWPVLAEPETGKMRKAFTSDGLHLSGAGYRAWTDAVRPYVEGLFIEETDVQENTPAEVPVPDAYPDGASQSAQQSSTPSSDQETRGENESFSILKNLEK